MVGLRGGLPDGNNTIAHRMCRPRLEQDQSGAAQRRVRIVMWSGGRARPALFCRAEPKLGFGCMSRAWAMPVVLTGTLRAVASDVGSGSCRYLRLYDNVAQAICTTRAFWHSG
ncbi:hypothetical protein MG068_20440 [Stenotrophomonas sp. ASS1]|nr:hypothetical protein MG068_20440 [Stenotrophomonas sp. ASS1]